MSVEETNRVRAMLGLKPLNVGGNASGKPTEEEVNRELSHWHDRKCFSRRGTTLEVAKFLWVYARYPSGHTMHLLRATTCPANVRGEMA